jgi:hypothetical protein
MLSGRAALRRCVSLPVLASIEKLETVSGSPRVPTWSTRLSGLTAIGVVGPALARPGIGTFSTSVRPPLFASSAKT